MPDNTDLNSFVTAMLADGADPVAVNEILGGLEPTLFAATALEGEELLAELPLPLCLPDAAVLPDFSAIPGPLGALLASNVFDMDQLFEIVGGFFSIAPSPEELEGEEIVIDLPLPFTQVDADSELDLAAITGPIGSFLAGGAFELAAVGEFIGTGGALARPLAELTGDEDIFSFPIAIALPDVPDTADDADIGLAILDFKVALEANLAGLQSAFAALKGVAPKANDLLEAVTQLMLALKADVSVDVSANIDSIVADLSLVIG